MNMPILTLSFKCECGKVSQFEAVSHCEISCECGNKYELKIGLYKLQDGRVE